MAFTRDHYGAKGRFHHVTYALDSREDVLRAADIFLENGMHIETGPHKHAIQQTFFLYVYEPGGNRVEVANAGARLVLAPDWKPITWTEAERKKGQAWGLKTIESFHTHGTPPLPDQHGTERARARTVKQTREVHHDDGRKNGSGGERAFRRLRVARRRRHRAACRARLRRDGDLPLLRRARRVGEAVAPGGMTLERVKAERQKEAEAAAKHLGVADIQFWDLGDYPIAPRRGIALPAGGRLPRRAPGLRADALASKDIYNRDHPAVTDFAQHARIIAQAHGHNPGQKVLGAPPVFLFEPHQPEQCDWKPTVLLDITPVWEKKRAAIECMAGQEHLWEYYTRVALQRGAQAARNSEKKITYGEGYESVFPHVLEVLA